ncbi:protein singles bar isoform X2 [Bombyx mandarina]|uniref:Protein singles bar isoform X2 n=1 Tax=Bombyx mandarina TaxID=7092 RepID=A0A6J2KI08_BOMMA|nr:protein singles bar isoform X2 [Bombyx mandarina]
MTRGPTIVRVAPGGGGSRGIKCCCCRCCECLNFGYLISNHGIIKLAEAMLGGLCQSLLVKYGMSEANSIGSAFHSFLTTASACLLTTSLLIACYVLSSKTQQLIRQSIFECLFNAVACFLYFSASSYMGVAVNLYLYHKYALVNMYAAYPAMTAVYYIGFIVGFLHGADAFISYKYFRGVY